MPSADYDLRFLEAGLELLENYLLSKDIYRPIGIQAPPGKPPYPQLTLGWLLLSLQRAQATCQTASEKADLAHIQGQIEAISVKWQSAWNTKAKAEFRARLNLWRDFLSEYGEQPANNTDRYPYEVSRRVLLQILGENSGQLPAADQQALNGLDLILRSHFRAGEFIWDANLIPNFPAADYWYLYGDLLHNKGTDD